MKDLKRYSIPISGFLMIFMLIYSMRNTTRFRSLSINRRYEAPAAMENFEKYLQVAELRDAMSYLLPRCRLVISLLYGIGGTPLARSEVAKRLNISVGYVGLLEYMGIHELRRALTGSNPYTHGDYFYRKKRNRVQLAKDRLFPEDVRIQAGIKLINWYKEQSKYTSLISIVRSGEFPKLVREKAEEELRNYYTAEKRYSVHQLVTLVALARDERLPEGLRGFMIRKAMDEYSKKQSAGALLQIAKDRKLPKAVREEAKIKAEELIKGACVNYKNPFFR